MREITSTSLSASELSNLNFLANKDGRDVSEYRLERQLGQTFATAPNGEIKTL